MCFPKSHCTLCFNTGITERQRKDYPGRPGSPPSCRNPGVPGLLICHLSSLESAFLKKKKKPVPPPSTLIPLPPPPSFPPWPIPKERKMERKWIFKDTHIHHHYLHSNVCLWLRFSKSGGHRSRKPERAWLPQIRIENALLKCTFNM